MSKNKEIPFGRPSITDEDRQAVMRVLEGHILTHGPECKQFESEFAALMGVGANCVTVSSGMAALHLAYLHFEVGPGDEVIVPAQTHTATVHAVEWVGATPVFADCDSQTGNMTAESIKALITPRTKAIGVVHLLGIPCDMPSIMAVAGDHRLRVVEDCAVAIGSRWGERHVGLFGDAACFSFYPVKHITTGEGGMFASKHREVAEAVARLRAFGVDRTHSERAVAGMYDVPTLGLNYRMSELQAALGRGQIRRFSGNLAKRRTNFESLKEMLSDVSNIRVLDATHPDAQNSHYCLSIVLEGTLASGRTKIAAALNEAGIGTSVYYPQPVPRMTYYRKKYGYDAMLYRNAAEISDCSIALPVGPHVELEDIRFIGSQLKNIIKSYPA